LANISSCVYNNGLRLHQLFKSFNKEGTGCTPEQLLDGLKSVGVGEDPDTVMRLAQPFFNSETGRLAYGGFVKMLAQNQ
jgi:hypothetical protein